MATLKRWLTVTRLVGLVAISLGVLGFGLTYAWVSWTLPERQPGLLLCGLLTIGGVALFTSSRAAAQESSPASLVNVASCSALVLALFVATSNELALRLWFETVTRLL